MKLKTLCQSAAAPRTGMLTLTFVLLAVLAGCGSGPEKAGAPPLIAPAAQAKDFSITFVISGDTAGFIVPCGCTTKQFGGLPRRATYLKSVREQFGPQTIYLDAGGSIQRGTAYDRVKFEFILKGMSLMNVAALNIGAGEMTLTPAQLISYLPRVPFMSSNIRQPDAKNDTWLACGEVEFSNGIPLTEPYLRVAILGVDLNAKKSAQFAISDPHSALLNEIQNHKNESDLIVLLAYGDEHDALKLAADFPEVSAVFVAGCAQSFTPRTENGVIAAGVAQKGKFLARATLNGHRNNWKLAGGEIVELSESFSDDPAQLANLNAYKKKLMELKIDPKESGEAPSLLAHLPAQYGYAGSAACIKCHIQDGVIHQASQHAHGLETLRNKDFAYDPFCLKCHTTGYGGPGGFVNADVSAKLGGIGCENCHGPSLAHAANPRVRTVLSDTKSACLSCHDPENSPKFDYHLYWAKIAHGQEKVK